MISGILQKCMFFDSIHVLSVFSCLLSYCGHCYSNYVRPKKKLKPLEGQTQLSFAKWPEASKHQEQDTETAIEKDDAKANEDNEESAQAKSVNLRNKDYLSHGSKYICGWSTRKMEIICTAKSAWGLI